MNSKLLSKLMFYLLSIACTLIVLTIPVAGENSPAEAQRDAEEEYLLKVNHACATQINITYDATSLVKYNQDIRYDQTGGGNECNEPLRYLWYLCKSAAGKEIVKSARLSKLVCKGTAAKTGALTMTQNTITVERAFEEKQPFARSKKQFEAIFKTKLEMPSDDPYYDREWRSLKLKPNPVTDTKTYCLVNGEKVAWRDAGFDSFMHRKEDATVKCWKDGELVTALTFGKGLRTGYETYFRDEVAMLSRYLDGKKDGRQTITTNGTLTELLMYEKGKEQWRTTYYPSGKLSRHSRAFKDHIDEISLAEDGKVISVRCSPQAGDDKELRKWCGFEGEVSHSVYDGTGRVSKVVAYKDGVLQREGPGSSDYGSGRKVSYQGGKKHGEELIVDKTGKLRGSITWNLGVKDGRELKYAEDGKRVISEVLWKAGDLRQLTEFYLNGNPKLREVFDAQKKQQQRFWDTGKVSAEGTLLPCKNGYRDWCEEGVFKTYYETGAPESETTWKAGRRHGVSKGWRENGKPSELEDYADGKLTKRKAWDKDAKLTQDEEYEADGSRKLKK